MAKGQTPEQKFKRLYDLANSYDPEKGPAKENEAAERKWREWLKRNGKTPIDVPRSQRKPKDCKRVFKRSEFEAALSKAEVVSLRLRLPAR